MTFKESQRKNKQTFVDTSSGWYLTSVFPVRSAGFPYEWLEQLQCRATAQITDILVNAIKQLQHFGRTIRVQLSASRLDNPLSIEVHHLRRIEQCIRKLKIVAEQDKEACFHLTLRKAIDEWNQKIAHLHELMAQANATWETELAQSEKTLKNIVQNEQFMEAVFLSSPSMEEALHRFLSGQLKAGERRYIMLKLVRYIQRLCAKNETSSFFGPIAYGVLCENGPSLQMMGEVGGKLPIRKTFFALWAAQTLANMWEKEPSFEAEQYAMRSARLFLTMEQSKLTPMEQTILTYADGSKSLHEIAHDMHYPLSEIVTLAQTLAEKQLLHLGFPLDAYALDGLEELQRLLSKMQIDKDHHIWQKWEKILSSLQQIRNEFAQAAFPERPNLLRQAESIFFAISGVSPRRGAGQHYADRLLFYEECAAPFSISIGGKLASVLPQVLAPSLTAVAYDSVTNHLLQQRATDNLSHQEAIPLNDLSDKRLSDAAPVHRDSWVSFVQERSAYAGKTISFQKSDINSLVLSGSSGLFVAPDVMIAAKDRDAIERGDYRIILGEAQHVLPMSSLPLMIFYDDKEAATQEVRDAIQSITTPARPAIFALERKTKGLDIVPFDSMIVIQHEWLKPVGSIRAIAYGDLTTRVNANGHRELHADGIQEALVIFPHYEDQGNPELPDALSPFVLPAIDKQPVILGQHTSRIEVDGVVWQRERWDLQTRDLPLPNNCRDFQAYLQMWQWKHFLQLPDQVFAQTPKEPKPWLVDFLSPLSCAVFLQMIRDSSSLTLTEMLPRPDELWLRGPNGRYTSEFRLTAFWHASHTSVTHNEKEGEIDGHD